MEPPLGSQPCPLGLVQPLQPARPGEVGHLSHPIATPPLIEHCRARLNGDNLRTAPNPSQLNVIAIPLLGIVRHVPALPAPGSARPFGCGLSISSNATPRSWKRTRNSPSRPCWTVIRAPAPRLGLPFPRYTRAGPLQCSPTMRPSNRRGYG